MILYKNVLEKLCSDINELDHQFPDLLKRSEKGMELALRANDELKQLMRKNKFRTFKDEIYFFKRLQPKVLSYLIIYSVILTCEGKRSSYTDEEHAEFIKGKLDFVKAHYEDYSEFLSYYNSESDHHDDIYFKRHSGKLPVVHSASYNSEFTTGYDAIAANIIAFKELKSYFENLENLSPIIQTSSNATWTSPKIALGELIYALNETRSFNHGNIGLNQLTTEFETAFNLELGDVYRMLPEIRARKKDRCRFLLELINKLEQKMDTLDG